MRRSEKTLRLAVTELEQDILFGRLRPCERLTEDGLIGRFGLTRHVARQVLAELERTGIVVRERNRSATVRDFTREEVEQITAVRELLNAQAAALIPLPAPPELVRRLEALHRRHSAAVAKNDPYAIHHANNAFHETLFAACGNKYLAQTIKDYAQLSLAFRCHLMTSPWHAQQAREEHAQIIDALKQGHRQALMRLCVDHIRPSKDVYAMLRGWIPPAFAEPHAALSPAPASAPRAPQRPRRRAAL